ncbi:MAG TPA: hypothetical protein DIC22_06445 [Chitinophagaceae bacterium]|nr:hypothetical protein [Chitinophagaceae bacterium]
MFGKFSRRALDKQLGLNHGYWNCYRFPHGSWISGMFFSGLDFRIRSGFRVRIGFNGIWIGFYRIGFGFQDRIKRARS